MIEEKCLDGGLEEVNQVVVAPDVGELVRQHRFERLRRKPGHRRDRQQDRRPKNAESRGHGDGGGLQEADSSGDPEFLRGARENGFHGRRRVRDTASRQGPDAGAAGQKPKREDQHSEDPD